MHKALLKSAIKKHKATLIGIAALMFLVSVALATVITVWTNSTAYMAAQLHRAGFGDLTAWTSGLADTEQLAKEISALEPIERVEAQTLVFSNYIINGEESDSEGQLILYNEKENRYKFFADDLADYDVAPTEIAKGQVYVSPSLISMLGIKLGDTIDFAVARNGQSLSLVVKGFYEDPFMGSSMIGMKGFLVSPQDMALISEMIQNEGIDALARKGAMLHIFAKPTESLTTAELNRVINQSTNLPSYTEFVHSAQAISGFMLVLHNAFCALLLAFVLVLLIVALVALGHGIANNIEADYINMGILKAVGFTTTRLRQLQLLQYGIAILPSMLLGLALAAPVSHFVSSVTLTTTGIKIPAALPLGVCVAVFVLILGVLCMFIAFKTAIIGKIKPMAAIRGEAAQATIAVSVRGRISAKYLSLSLAVRQLAAGKKKYVGACIVAVLLVFFASAVGRMDAWLGPEGKGMMDAFNPADHHIGVQMFGKHTNQEAQQLAEQFSSITHSYQLAMVSTSVNGIDYTANVITQPELFHILEGKTSMAHNEIVVTEFVADDLGVVIGDKVTVTGDLGSREYIVAGIYSCANEMGANIGMSREGYLRIAQDNPQIWCDHYFLEDISKKADITKALTERFGGDVHVHENTWPGLAGIIIAMRALVAFMYIVVALFTLIIIVMTADKILGAEKKDMGIFKAIGFTDHKLRLSFALRFGVAGGIGSVLGAAVAAAFADVLVGAVMKLAGISNFAAAPGLGAIAFPIAFVTLLFMGFAYMAAGKIKQTDLNILVAE